MNHKTLTTKQPRALYVLFFAELWERFSYYGLQAILVLYLTKHFLFTDAKANALYGTFSALCFGLTIVGGYLADTLLGARKAITIGSILLILGNLVLLVPKLEIIPLGLALFVCGTSLFKPNASSLLGSFYDDDDPRRNSGFTIFYMGVNIGGLAGPLFYGLITNSYGWQAGFILGALGMALSQIVFWWQEKNFSDKGLPHRKKLQRSYSGISTQYLIYVGILLSVIGITLLISKTEIFGTLLGIFGLIVTAFELFIAFKSPPAQRNKIIALVLLTFFVVFFYAIILQDYSSIMLFVERNVDRHVFGFEMPSATFASLQPLFVVILAPILSLVWLALAKRHREPSTPMKFFFGLLMACLSLGVITLASGQALEIGSCSIAWIILLTFLQGAGDICLGPSGLAAVTTLAPARLVSMFMGIFFLAIACSGYIAGALGQLAAVDPKQIKTLDLVTSANIYHLAFLKMFYASIAVTVLALILTPVIKRLMK